MIKIDTEKYLFFYAKVFERKRTTLTLLDSIILKSIITELKLLTTPNSKFLVCLKEAVLTAITKVSNSHFILFHLVC